MPENKKTSWFYRHLKAGFESDCGEECDGLALRFDPDDAESEHSAAELADDNASCGKFMEKDEAAEKAVEADAGEQQKGSAIPNDEEHKSDRIYIPIYRKPVEPAAENAPKPTTSRKRMKEVPNLAENEPETVKIDADVDQKDANEPEPPDHDYLGKSVEEKLQVVSDLKSKIVDLEAKIEQVRLLPFTVCGWFLEPFGRNEPISEPNWTHSTTNPPKPKANWTRKFFARRSGFPGLFENASNVLWRRWIKNKVF